MKLSRLRMFYVVVICSLAFFTVSCNHKPKPNLSTPQNCWASFLAALKTGDEKLVKSCCTEEGYKSLFQGMGKNESVSERLKLAGQNWSGHKLNWDNASRKEDEIECRMEIIAPVDIWEKFKKIDGKWFFAGTIHYEG